jgi:hypothetical protein
MSATTTSEITATLNKELQSVLEWVFQKLKALYLGQTIQ